MAKKKKNYVAASLWAKKATSFFSSFSKNKDTNTEQLLTQELDKNKETPKTAVIEKEGKKSKHQGNKSRITDIEKFHLLRELQALLRNSKPYGDILHYLAEKHEITASRTAEYWISQARKELKRLYDIDDQQKAYETAATFDEIKQRAIKAGKLSTALRAEREKAHLFGLYKPRKHSLTDTEGNDLVIRILDDDEPKQLTPKLDKVKETPKSGTSKRGPGSKKTTAKKKVTSKKKTNSRRTKTKAKKKATPKKKKT